MNCRISEETEHISDVGGFIDAVENQSTQQTERNSSVSASYGDTVKAETKILTPKKRQSAESDRVSSGAIGNAIYPLNSSFLSLALFFPL